MNAVRCAHPSPSIPSHEPEERSTFNIQRPTSKAGAKRSALDVQSWALNVECFPCGSGAQCVNYSGKSLPVEWRGKLATDAWLMFRAFRDSDASGVFVQKAAGLRVPSPLNGERARVRGGDFVSAWQKEQPAECSHPSPSIFTPSLY